MAKMQANPVAALVELLRGLSVTEIGKEVRVVRAGIDSWRKGWTQPNDQSRARLVTLARRRAEELTRLAVRVERDGRASR